MLHAPPHEFTQITPASMSGNAMILEAQAQFAMGLLREATAADATASMIMSPISVAIALSMAFAGARHETADQFIKLLANGAQTDEIHRHFGALLRLIANDDKKYKLESANRIYVQERFTLLETYKKVLTNHYMGQFESVDFAQSAVAAKKINDFVEKATHEKIKNLLNPSDLDSDTKAVLINAIYFKGSWKNKFDEKATKKKQFHMSENSKKEVDMMHMPEKKFPYYSDEHVQVLGLPYVGEEVFMYVVLPKERFGLQKLIHGTNGTTLLNWIKNSEETDVMVELPKFKLESKLELKDPLIKLGLDKAFSGKADFSGMTEGGGLAISDVIQKAFIEVNEEDTEAAAATAIEFAYLSASFPHFERFIADRSFLYFLVTAQNHVLFAGQFSG